MHTTLGERIDDRRQDALLGERVRRRDTPVVEDQPERESSFDGHVDPAAHLPAETPLERIADARRQELGPHVELDIGRADKNLAERTHLSQGYDEPRSSENAHETGVYLEQPDVLLLGVPA